MSSLFQCILCDNPMHAGTKPYWIIDPETLEVLGISHSTCRGKLKMPDMRLEFSTRVGFWGPKGPVSAPPSREVIEFSSKMIRFRTSLPQWETNQDFRLRILLGYAFTKATSVTEFFALSEIQRMVKWWQNPKNKAKNLSDEELDELKGRFKEGLN